jgi:hypothetical protein
VPIYYVCGIPYSDELYHSGVKGQKWGIRRYQNEDGTLTPLGKIHYGAQKVGSAVGQAGKAVGKAGKAVAQYEIKRFKRRHLSLMSDKELDEELARSKKINQISKERAEARGRKVTGKLSALIWKTAGVGTEKFAENLAVTAGKKAAEKMMLSKDEKVANKYKNKIERMTQEMNYYGKVTDRKDNSYHANKEKYKKMKKEERKEKYDKIKDSAKKGYSRVKSAASSAAPGSKKAVNAYVQAAEDYERALAYEREKEERRRKYGPGGTAYR